MIAGALSFYEDKYNQIRNAKLVEYPKNKFNEKKKIGKDLAIILLSKRLILGDAVKAINLPPLNYVPERKI